MGRDLREALGMRFPNGKDPVAIVLEWGVRQLDVPVLIRHSAGHDKAVRCDLFPAYDEDGGLLCSLAPDRRRDRRLRAFPECLGCFLTLHQKA